MKRAAPRVLPIDVCRDNGLPVSPNWLYDLRRPFRFEGTVARVTFDPN